MTPMFADWLREQSGLRRHVRSLVFLFVNGLGTHWQPRPTNNRSRQIPARCANTAGSVGSDSVEATAHPDASKHPVRLRCRDPRGPAPQTKGETDLTEPADPSDRSTASTPPRTTSRVENGTASGRRRYPRPLNKKMTRGRPCRRSPDCSRSQSANIGVIDVRNPR